MTNLKPFFCFFGGKWRSAPRYPAPTEANIVEPFAGAAGYSVRHAERNVTLVERDPTIAALWRYLISVKAAEVLALPLRVDDARTLPVCSEAKALIGFWLNKGMTAPCNIPSKWMRDQLAEGGRLNTYWGEGVRARIATQVESIRHWRVIEGSYADAPSGSATWFVDPPYQEAGQRYRHGAKDIDFEGLAEFCLSREGQVIVCENTGATWLPFSHFADTKSLEGKHGKAKSAEAIYYSPAQTARAEEAA